ncbi:LysE family translocator [Amycolatopsis sp. CA-230715]|uniref:LysE family translocator n=1 Tax=Amycolatopsis sp. CA-230715 TaxID=2745196 RepID=UPI001C01CD41|nr:LysE family translocator [Amycolatopsis sp. CA-230715]QWF78889.1 Homoserine/homoserine lactone efflux protein [Amycolatopsis sp. CA-230715]
MVDASLYLAFLVAAVVLVIIPGPDMLMILALGMRHGPAAGFMAALGVSVGLAVHTAAAALGLSALFTYVPVLYDGLRWAGAAYLLYLAVMAFRDRSALNPDEGDAPAQTSHWKCFWRAVLTNVLNPKVIVFNVAFLPQFVNPALGSVGLQLFVLGATLVLVDLMIDGPIGLAAGKLGKLVRNRKVARGLNVGCGAIFTALAVRLVVAD